MADNPEFYRNKLKLFIAIAPTVFLGGVKSQIFRDVFESETAVRIIESQGPEYLT